MKSFKGASSGPIVCQAVTVNVTPTAALAAQTGVYQAVAMPASPGCQVGQKVVVNPAADLSTVSYLLGDYYISLANTVRLHWGNISAGPLSPAALNLDFVFLGAIGAV